jgi:radical SAM protein with 4Fe4S-binding SPASM domain
MTPERVQFLRNVRQTTGMPFDSLCYAPFVQMSLSPNGDVSACCNSRSYALGNIRRHRLLDVWRGERAREVRASLRRYEFARGCEFCKWSVESGSPNPPLRDFDGVRPEADWPVMLELALSNRCNLACVQCSPELSSTIRAKSGLPPLPPACGEEFFADLRQFLPHLRKLSFLGGEPFLQDECHRIWAMLVEQGLHPVCHVTTNGTIYDARVEQWLQALPFDLSISVDGVTKATVESIRVNARFERQRENIRRFREYAIGTGDRHARQRQPRLKFNFCVMPQNWHELADFFQWAEELDAVAWTTVVDHPPAFSLFSLPKPELHRIVTAITARADAVAATLVRNHGAWRMLVAELEAMARNDADATVDQIGVDAIDNRIAAPDDLVSHMHVAWEAMARGDRATALVAASRVSTEDSHWFDASLLRGELLTAAADFGAAEQVLLQVLAQAERHPAVHMRLGWLRLGQQRPADAVRHADDGLKLLATTRGVESWVSDGLYNVRALALAQLGDRAAAMRCAQEWIAVAPDNREARDLAHRLGERR